MWWWCSVVINPKLGLPPGLRAEYKNSPRRLIRRCAQLSSSKSFVYLQLVIPIGWLVLIFFAKNTVNLSAVSMNFKKPGPNDCKVFFFWQHRKCVNVRVIGLAWNPSAPFLRFLTSITHIFGHRESGHMGHRATWTWCIWPLCKPRQSATRTLPVADIKGIGWFNIFNTPSQFPSQDLSDTFKMSNINATRLPIFSELICWSYVGDDVTHTLIRGDRWAQHPSNDVPQLYLYSVY